MRRCAFFAVILTALVLPLQAMADGDLEVGSSPLEQPMSAEALDPDDATLAAGAGPVPPAAATPQTPAASERDEDDAATVGKTIELGPEGIDDRGRRGRLHTVTRGDTLWDLSAAYLGTPWVWPSVWIDNDDIQNPHLIRPGDKIWITADEMRIVSDAEAESFLAPQPEQLETASPSPSPAAPVSPSDDAAIPLAALPVEVPGALAAAGDGDSITVSHRDAMGFLSAEHFKGSSTIVDSPVERTFLAQGDPVYLGMGEGELEVGDQFTIFQVIEDVRDSDSNRLLGHHIETLGWLEVTKLTGDTSVAEIRMSYSEIARGVRVTPRPKLPRTVTTRTTPDAIEGKIVFLPSERTIAAGGEYVYLNRGELHGVELGSELEVYESGEILPERTRNVDVRTPDLVVARVVVIRVEPESSVGYVIGAERELVVGDTVRPRLPKLAQRWP
jgi:hypothetical protein